MSEGSTFSESLSITRVTYKTIQIREITLMSHAMRLWERVIRWRLEQETYITKNQFGSMSGRFTTMDAIYLLQRLVDLHMVSIDLEEGVG